MLRIVFALMLLGTISASRVIELNNKLLDIYPKDERGFLIKFYAPWCHYCHEFEPIFNQVAQKLYNVEPDIIVGRVDCIHNSAVAKHFGIQGFPTVLYIHKDKRIEYRGDRILEELVEFALRVHGPPVRYLAACSQIAGLVEKNRVLFINFGPKEDREFAEIAPKMQPNDWFFRSLLQCDRFEKSGIYAVKARNVSIQYDPENDGPLAKWVEHNRFPHYAKLTTGRLPFAFATRKDMVIAVVQQHPKSDLMAHPNSTATRALLERIAFEDAGKLGLNDVALFAWCSDLRTLNSMTVWNIKPLPNILVLNATTLEYCVFDESGIDGGAKRPMTRDTVLEFLKDVFHDQSVAFYGGDSMFYRFKRMVYDLVRNVVGMYNGNPVLTLLLLGLPVSFLAMIIYVSCYSSMFMDKDGGSYDRLYDDEDEYDDDVENEADEDEDAEEEGNGQDVESRNDGHEKKD